MATMIMSPGQPQMAEIDVASATMASQSSMSGGKIQYTPEQLPTNQVPSVTLTPQILQLLASSGLLTSQQPNQSNPLLQAQQQQPAPQTFQPNAGMQQIQTAQQPPNPQIELLKQYLLHALSNQQGQTGNQASNNPIVTNTDPNMQSQNQEMSSLGSFDPNLLQSFLTDSPMVSFEGYDGLNSNITDLNFDPNIAGFETVGGDSSAQSSQQQYDEASAAVQNLNG